MAVYGITISSEYLTPLNLLSLFYKLRMRWYSISSELRRRTFNIKFIPSISRLISLNSFIWHINGFGRTFIEYPQPSVGGSRLRLVSVLREKRLGMHTCQFRSQMTVAQCYPRSYSLQKVGKEEYNTCILMKSPLWR